MAEPKVIVREQSRRWASCDRIGVLRFNRRIIQSPIRLVDYVVAHELVHLVHANHRDAFIHASPCAWLLVAARQSDTRL